MESLINKSIIELLVEKITKNEKLDSQVEHYIKEIAEDFIETNLNTAFLIGKHKNNDTLTSEEVSLSMEKNYNIKEIPKKGSSSFTQFKMNDIQKNPTADHMKRLELSKEENKITID